MADIPFPDYAVDKLFEEFNAKRGEDCYTVLFIQTEVFSVCLMDKLKPAIANCVLQQRKFLSERDVLTAAEFPSVVPRSHVKSRERLFQSLPFKKACEAHIEAAQEVLKRLHEEGGIIKISAETALILQEVVEAHMRGYFQYLLKDVGGRRVIGYKECVSALSALVGHSWNDE